ncbi:MAG: Sporulation protein [Ramlibacter sp.]|nr:Sporulation protein [Ramlibacter sp.]MDB5911786.1 Sporulation protein [Ramlibacter sp.]
MALFKLRKKVDEPKAPPSPAESIEAMRRRARHRLIGAVVLVLAGVIGFPILFDTQPRPVSVDIPIEIPDRNKVKPLPLPSQAAAPAAKAPAPAASVITESKAEAAAAVERPPPKPAPAEKVAKSPPAEKKPEPKTEARPEQKTLTADEASKARALLEGSSVGTADAGGARFVVQVGAFAEKEKARLAQQKLERAGLKNYTNVAETRDGTRIRVRAGPFASRAEADKAAQKIKGLDLPAAVLTL